MTNTTATDLEKRLYVAMNSILNADRCVSASYMITQFGDIAVAKYILLRKGPRGLTRYEAFMEAFGHKWNGREQNFKLVTTVCENFESTDFYNAEEAVEAAEGMLAERRRFDEGFASFIEKLSAV